MFRNSLYGIILLSVISSSSVYADVVKLASINAVKETVEDRVRAFEKTNGHTVTITWASSEGIRNRISDGEVADVVILPAQSIDRLVTENKIIAGSRVDFAKTGIGVAIPLGFPKLDISTGENVKKAILEAKKISFSIGPSGVYLVELIKRFGISEQVKDKIVRTVAGSPVSGVLERGEADLGFQQVSELIHAKGIQYLGPLPADVQNMTTYSMSLHVTAATSDAAKSLIKFLTAPESAPAIRNQGMEPG